ncbi:MAG: hypothetical protein LBC28_03065 [Oscillospiraceae bacterium]|jgi:hypothetical protein|nr:hypothetical protein [Oscillospiraceae bacterium]
MKNFTVLDNGSIQTPFGVFAGVTSHRCYSGGELQGLSLGARNMLLTHAGELVPFYTETPRRKQKFAVEYYKNGMLKAVALEEQQEVITPIGEMPAELVTFYDTGELLRLFPLDGKIGAYWGEADERALHIPLSFSFDFAEFTALIDCVCFYKSGAVRSVTLFPGETAELNTLTGSVLAERGFSLNEDGSLRSLSPGELRVLGERIECADCDGCPGCA